MKKTIIFIGSILILGACAPKEQPGQTQERAQVVRVVPAEQTTYRIPVRATGLLGSATEMKLSFKTGGIIESISAREGSSVKRGSELARLDLSEIQAQVSQARIGLEKAGRDLERARNLHRDSVATLEQLQNAQSAYELASSQKEVAEFNLRHSVIRAPSDGKIQKVLVEYNEVIAPGYPAILFGSTESDWVVRASVTDKDIVQLSMGDSALVQMDAFPDMDFQAVVAELASVADPVSGTYEVEVMLSGTHPQFRTGFICRLEIAPAQSRNGLTVPIETLVNASDRRAEVFVYQEGVVEKRKVHTGRILGARVLIREGLAEGEQVVREGAPYLKDGEKVRLATDPMEGDRP